MHRSISKSHISLSYLYLQHLILRSVLLELVNASTSNLVHATQSDTMLWWNTMPSYATWCENMLLVGIQYHHPVSSWCPEGKNSQAGILSSNIYRALWHCILNRRIDYWNSQCIHALPGGLLLRQISPPQGWRARLGHIELKSYRAGLVAAWFISFQAGTLPLLFPRVSLKASSSWHISCNKVLIYSIWGWKERNREICRSGHGWPCCYSPTTWLTFPSHAIRHHMAMWPSGSCVCVYVCVCVCVCSPSCRYIKAILERRGWRNQRGPAVHAAPKSEWWSATPLCLFLQGTLDAGNVPSRKFRKY